MFPLQDLDKITFHIDVNVAVAIEGTASFDVAGECGDEVRIFDQFVDVADEGAASHMAAGNLIDRNFLFGAGNGVKFGYEVCDFSLFEDDLDVVIKSFRAFKREKLISGIICISTLIYFLISDKIPLI